MTGYLQLQLNNQKKKQVCNSLIGMYYYQLGSLFSSLHLDLKRNQIQRNQRNSEVLLCSLQNS